MKKGNSLFNSTITVFLVAWASLGTVEAEPIPKVSLASASTTQKGRYQIRPIIPLNQKAQTLVSAPTPSSTLPEVNSVSAHNLTDDTIAEPTYAGASTKMNRIPPPPIPVEGQTKQVEELPKHEKPLVSTGPIDHSTPIIEPAIPGPESVIPEPSYAKVDSHSASTPKPTIADKPPAPKPVAAKPKAVGSKPKAVASKPDTPKPTAYSKPVTKAVPAGPTLDELRKKAHELANQGLDYVFGADDPKSGGLDCSGVVQHLLTDIGVKGVPRTSYDQYYWLKKQKMLDDVFGRKADQKLFKKLAPGDLIFWGNTWKSGHRVSHVMIYLGWNKSEDKHYIFGAQGRKSKGLLGNGVDIFELEPNRGRLIAHGKIPGLKY